MSTITYPVGARTALTTTAMNSLASATYVSCGVIALNTDKPYDLLLEVTVSPGTVASEKQCYVFAKRSVDGTNFETGPESGTTATDEPNLTPIGAVPCNTSSVAQTRVFSLRAAFGGALPHSARIVVLNQTGAALAASGHSVHYSAVVPVVA